MAISELQQSFVPQQSNWYSFVNVTLFTDTFVVVSWNVQTNSFGKGEVTLRNT